MKIPHFKDENGKFIYFKRSELDAWMTRYPVKTEEQLISEVTTAGIVGKIKRRKVAKD